MKLQYTAPYSVIQFLFDLLVHSSLNIHKAGVGRHNMSVFSFLLYLSHYLQYVNHCQTK